MLYSSSSGVPCHRRASTSPRAAEAEATADRPSSSGRSLFSASNSLSNCGRKSLVSLLRAPTHLLNSASHLPAKVHLLLNGLLEVRHPVLEPSHARIRVVTLHNCSRSVSSPGRAVRRLLLVQNLQHHRQDCQCHGRCLPGHWAQL